jgi:hypothetical protein
VADLERAQENVRRGQIIILEQKTRIAVLEAEGCDTTHSEMLLATFEACLRIFEDHRDAILKELDRH